jgi:hypothetical protein
MFEEARNHAPKAQKTLFETQEVGIVRSGGW